MATLCQQLLVYILRFSLASISSLPRLKGVNVEEKQVGYLPPYLLGDQVPGAGRGRCLSARVEHCQNFSGRFVPVGYNLRRRKGIFNKKKFLKKILLLLRIILKNVPYNTQISSQS
jgi:hypothetical protein